MPDFPSNIHHIQAVFRCARRSDVSFAATPNRFNRVHEAVIRRQAENGDPLTPGKFVDNKLLERRAPSIGFNVLLDGLEQNRLCVLWPEWNPVSNHEIFHDRLAAAFRRRLKI